MRHRLTIASVGAAMALTVLAAGSPAQAITFGTNDGGRHPNVGSLVGVLPDVGPVQWCSGTLISPTVFLTASHCFAGPTTSTSS